jgi:hypothetical protein
MPSLSTVRLQIIHRCKGLLLSRSAWPVMLVFLSEVDPAEWLKNRRLIAWPPMTLMRQRTRLSRHRVEYGKAELKAIGLLHCLHHSNIGQPAHYELRADFVAPSNYIRKLDGVLLAPPRKSRCLAGVRTLHMPVEEGPMAEQKEQIKRIQQRCRFEGCTRTRIWSREGEPEPEEGWQILSDWAPGVPYGAYCPEHVGAVQALLERQALEFHKLLQASKRGRK